MKVAHALIFICLCKQALEEVKQIYKNIHFHIRLIFIAKGKRIAQLQLKTCL